MNMTLKRIKRFIIHEQYVFTLKAETELEIDGLIIEDALESILNADDIYKVLNSHHPKTGKPEKLYIIKGLTYDDVLIYTKGKICEEDGKEGFYVLISSKKAL